MDEDLEGNSERVKEEMEVLESIFEGCISIPKQGELTFKDSENDFLLTFKLPPTYPSSGRPSFALEIGGIVSRSKFDTAVEALTQTVSQNEGCETLFQCIEQAREILHREEKEAPIRENKAPTSAENGSKGSGGDAALDEADEDPDLLRMLRNASFWDSNPFGLEIHHSEPVTEKKSTFQAHFCRVQSRDEVEAFRSSILMDKRCQRATHNIMAYRFVDPVTRLVCSDCDDDGESAAGGRLAEMIRLMGCDGVVAIVSRWFGGTLLGPDRFKLINNTARSLLEAHGYGGKDREKGKKHENCSTYLRGGGQSNKKGSRHDR